MEQRKILFKAKRLDNGEWVVGSLVNNPIGPVIVWWEDSIENIVDVDPSTVCQFTGIYDKDGKEIFEYDKLQDTESNFVRMVVWGNNTCGFVFARPNGASTGKRLSVSHTAFMRVVGNKFDRKEGEK